MEEQALRERIVRIGRLMYQRHLTDSAGGNISARYGSRILSTPRYAGSRRQWELSPDLILNVDPENLAEEQTSLISREIATHFAIYREIPAAQAVIHAHPRYVMPFATLGKPIPPVWEDTVKFGTIGLVPETPAHSPALAEEVVRVLVPIADKLDKNAIAVQVPKHGLVVAGRSLDDAYDCLERINGNAECILLMKLLTQDE